MPLDGQRIDLDSESRSLRVHKTSLFSIAQTLGIPTILLQILGPRLARIFQQRPRTVMSALVSAAVLSSGYLLKDKVMSKFATVNLTATDPLYKALRKFIFDEYPPTDLQLRWTAHSTEFQRTHVSRDMAWPRDHQGSKDIFSEYSGKHWFRHNGTVFCADLQQKTGNKYDNQAITLKALSFSREPIRLLLQEAWDTFMSDSGARTTAIYQVMDHGRLKWALQNRSDARTLDSIHIALDDKSRILDSITQYLDPERKAWYQRQGIPYRQGFLFAGPPGTGKSSLAMAIAGQFNLKFCSLSLLREGLTDSSLQTLFAHIPTPSVLVLEDVDSAGLGRETIVKNEMDNGEGATRGGITLSGLLNALDGAAAPQGHILILTTNAPEKLDPALIREGRCDRTINFRLADREIIKSIFKRMLDEADVSSERLDAKATEFADRIPEGLFSPARIQVYLLDYINNVDGAVADAEEWVVKMQAQDKELAERKRMVIRLKKKAKPQQHAGPSKGAPDESRRRRNDGNHENTSTQASNDVSTGLITSLHSFPNEGS